MVLSINAGTPIAVVADHVNIDQNKQPQNVKVFYQLNDGRIGFSDNVPDGGNSLGGYSQPEAITEGPDPKPGSPLVPVANKALTKISLFYISKANEVRELQWTDGSKGWSEEAVKINDEAITVLPKSSIAAVMLNDASFSTMLLYIPAVGSSIQSIKRVGVDKPWGNEKVVEGNPATGTRMAAVSAESNNVPFIRVFYQKAGKIPTWSETSYKDTGNATDVWTPKSWVPEGIAPQVAPGLAAAVVPNASAEQGKLRVYIVSTSSEISQYRLTKNGWVRDTLGPVRGDTRLAAFGYCDGSPDKVTMWVYGQDLKQNNTIIPYIVGADNIAHETTRIGLK